MKVIKEHNCEVLDTQECDENNYTTVQKLKFESGELNKKSSESWYFVNCDAGNTQAFSIDYCPYCGLELEVSDE